MSSSKKKIRHFVAMWDMFGLEFLEDLTAIDEQRTWAILKGQKEPELPPLNMMIMRAKVNQQRCYEIYTFESADFDKEGLKAMFEFSPQAIVDSIRNTGYKIYSDRNTAKQVIT